MSSVVLIQVSDHGYAEVDAEIATQLSLLDYHWCSNDGYAFNNRLGFMHRVIMGLVPRDQRFVHHVDEDKLNNRRSNLQVFESRSEANRAPHPKRDRRCSRSADEGAA